jgi:hypothetical protein
MTDLKDAVRASLTTLIAATDTAPNYLFAKPADMKELVDAGYAEGNPDLKNPNAKTEIAFRVTDAGRAAATGTQAATKPTYVIAKVAMPSIARQNSEGSKYPFASLEPEQAFFIPSEAKNASKSFGSLVSAENKKYAKNDASYRRFTSRTMTGDAFDPDGKLGLKGKKGVGVFRLSAAEEAKAKAKAFPTPAATA